MPEIVVAKDIQSSVPVVLDDNSGNVSDSGQDASQSGSESNGEPGASGFDHKDDDDQLISSNFSGSDERLRIDYMTKQKGIIF